MMPQLQTQTKSNLILPDYLEESQIPLQSLPFLLPELESSEVEDLLRRKPELAKAFVQKCAKGEINWESFTPTERGLILHGSLEAQFKEPEEVQAIQALVDADWLRQPPTPEEFVNNPKYLGAEMSAAIYPPWRKDLIYVLDPKNEIHEWILSGGIGVGKTRIAIISQLYKLCVLTCLRNIPAYFGLDSATAISFGLFSLSLEKADAAISEDFKKIISMSPYFKNVFPLKKTRAIRSVLNNQGSTSKNQSEYEVVLPQGLKILMGSKVQHALSFAVVSAILDEMNFRGKRTVTAEEDDDSSEKLYSQVRYRITSRFERLKYVPGILCVISSKKTSSDFLESHIAKLDGRLTQKTGSWVAQNDPHAYISTYSQWDVKPDKYWQEGEPKKSFYVFIGSSQNSSRILKPEEVADFGQSPNILEVPESTRHHFEYEINAALRELAGISSTPQHLLFEDPSKLKLMWDDRISPFQEDNIYLGLKTHRSLSSYIKSEEMYYDAGFSIVPKYHPSMLRVMHIDLSKSGDATGIAMGGVSALKEMVGNNLLGQKIVQAYSPEYFIDFAISIRAPQGDQVDYEKIQQFINYLRATGFRIGYITFDRFQSVGPMQMLIKDGFRVDNLSVDTTDIPHVFFRDAVIKGNVKMYRHKQLERECLNLIHDYSRARAKVDHPRMNPDGSVGRKDISDAVVGVVANAHATLTDMKKHPDTANADIANKIISSLYNKMATPDFPGYTVVPTTEAGQLAEHEDLMNPFNFNLRG